MAFLGTKMIRLQRHQHCAGSGQRAILRRHARLKPFFKSSIGTVVVYGKELPAKRIAAHNTAITR
jgi:hypothetical protein